MSFDVAQDNNLEQAEVEQGLQQGDALPSQQNQGNQDEERRRDQKIKSNLIEGVECSVTSTERYSVRFVNTTDKTIDVIWLDFTGQKVTYQTLSPQTAWSVYTYKTHPWIFRDSSNPNEKLVIKKHQSKSDFFECSDFLADLQSSAEFNSDQHNSLLNGNRPMCVLIQLPVEDLRQLALRTVRKQLPRKEDCFCLNILPQQIQFELARMFL